MQKLIPALVVLAFLAAPAAMAEYCDPGFVDDALERAVVASGGGYPARPFLPPNGITILNMTALVWDGPGGMYGEPISDLTGLQCAANLQDMMLTNGWISDLTPISGLEQLYCVDLTANEVADVSPVGGLPNLEVLILNDNWIRDVSPLAGVASLWWLHLENNSIRDISALTALTSLQRLYLNGNPLNQLAYDRYLPVIQANNPGIDLRYDPYVGPGDADMDGDVDLDDFVILKSGFAGPGTWQTGDFDGSATVDLEDFVILKQNFGGDAVPEPASAALLVVGLAVGLLRRRRGYTRHAAGRGGA